MEKRNKPRQLSVRINKSGKMLNFNTSASEQFAGYEDVEVLESHDVVAVRGAHGGDYHISCEAGRPRKTLSNIQLTTYLCQKFNCDKGTALPAWLGEDAGVIFFGGMQRQKNRVYRVDESYVPIEVEYNRRAGSWVYVHDNWIEFTQEIRDALPPRLCAYRSGRAVLLRGEASGELLLTPRRQKGNLMLVSHALADILRKMFGGHERGMRLRAQLLPGGVLLGDSMETLATAELLHLKHISVEETERCFVTITKSGRGTMNFSAMAIVQLKHAAGVTAYQCGDWLALKAEIGGPLRVTKYGYAHAIHNRALCNTLRGQWPECMKFYLIRHGDLWLLSPNGKKSGNIPPASMFLPLGTDVKAVQHKAKQKAEETIAYG